MGAGVLHFVRPGFYVAIMPPYLPGSHAFVYASGAAEIAGGRGVLLPPPVRRWLETGLVVHLRGGMRDLPPLYFGGPSARESGTSLRCSSGLTTCTSGSASAAKNVPSAPSRNSC